MTKTHGNQEDADLPVPTQAPSIVHPSVIEQNEIALSELAQEALVKFREVAEAIPTPDDDGAARIVLQILEAQSAADIDRPWGSHSLEHYRDHPLVVEAIKRLPSDYTGGLGLYLVCDCTNPTDGDKLTVVTGSVAVVAQLAKLYQLGAFPMKLIPRIASRPSKNGYYPQHLEVARS